MERRWTIRNCHPVPSYFQLHGMTDAPVLQFEETESVILGSSPRMTEEKYRPRMTEEKYCPRSNSLNDSSGLELRAASFLFGHYEGEEKVFIHKPNRYQLIPLHVRVGA